MKVREQESSHAEGKRMGGWGVTEVDEEKRRWFLEGGGEGEGGRREREGGVGKGEGGFERVSRYSMVAKRIW